MRVAVGRCRGVARRRCRREASTCAEPPPERTPTSAWPPMRAMLVSLRGGERKDAGGVLEQDDAFFFDLLGVVAAAEGIDDLFAMRRVVDDAVGEHAADDAVDHVVEAGLRDFAVEDGLLERVGEVVVVCRAGPYRGRRARP